MTWCCDGERCSLGCGCTRIEESNGICCGFLKRLHREIEVLNGERRVHARDPSGLACVVTYVC